ncbi:type VI secretion system baseplate subunit TssE [Aliikangiella marina]|uniref:Type VI secretion system baseplate subunit TssE n=1 Tax=Aliikangiella marina TaxID=1712262 RepID=A0A545TGZ8_9GAMM|nr:type VI secretion system baseplate subunit TssE [Aliikangiella marina]TQV76411.1 type VI secretion system baseplate subunit TssE [Aliikangiella marina]
MAYINKNKKLRPSILDRLIDDDPYNQSEIDTGREQKLAQLRNSVRRDLEKLLNTRYRVVEPPEELEQLELSLLNYGLPDLATVNTLDLQKKNEFTKSLEKLLKDFEPRFKSVNVKFVENQNNADRTLRFSIEATVYADPHPEKIVFDSLLEPVTRIVNVEEVR